MVIIDNSIFLSKGEKLREINELVCKIENLSMLELIYYLNSVFNGKSAYLELNKFNNTNNNVQAPSIPKNISYKNDLYEKLKEELKNKEMEIEGDDMNNSDPSESELLILKEILVDFKICPFDEKWYKKTSFVSEDATKCKVYANDNKQHYTHIYSYNQ
jgi:hypothetical protein